MERGSQGTLSYSLDVMLRVKGNHSTASSRRVTVSIRILTKSTQKQCRRGWVGPGAGKQAGDLLGSRSNDGSERHGVAWITITSNFHLP